MDEWYIGMHELRPMLMDVTRQIRWIPDFGLERELDWLRNMHDWMISKKRYWGLALPIWYCEACDAFDVIGSRDELQQRAVEGFSEFEGHSPHRPWVDTIKIACPGCGSAISRIPDVGNPWLDAGIVPFSTLHYRTDPDYWQRWFPGDFVTESFPGPVPQLVLLAAGHEHRARGPTALYQPARARHGARPGRAPHAQELGQLDRVQRGRRSRRRRRDALDLLSDEPGGQRQLRLEDNRRHHAPPAQAVGELQVLRAVREHRRLDARAGRRRSQVTELDRWLQSRLTALVQTVRERLDDYDAMDAARAIEEFLDGLSNWYIRRSRQRFYGSEGQAAFATLHETLVVLTSCSPHSCRSCPRSSSRTWCAAWMRARPRACITAPYPEVDAASRDVELEQHMEWARVVASLGNAARKGAGIPSRQPLPAVRVAGGSTFKDLPAWATSLVQEELNVRRVEFAEELTEAVRQKAEGNPKLLGPKFGKDYPRIRGALQAGRFSVDADGRVRVEEFELRARGSDRCRSSPRRAMPPRPIAACWWCWTPRSRRSCWPRVAPARSCA